MPPDQLTIVSSVLWQGAMEEQFTLAFDPTANKVPPIRKDHPRALRLLDFRDDDETRRRNRSAFCRPKGMIRREIDLPCFVLVKIVVRFTGPESPLPAAPK